MKKGILFFFDNWKIYTNHFQISKFFYFHYKARNEKENDFFLEIRQKFLKNTIYFLVLQNFKI